MIPTLLGIMILNVVIIQAAPGGPIDVMIARIKGQTSDATARLGGSPGGLPGLGGSGRPGFPSLGGAP